jgi:hypothetical protein
MTVPETVQIIGDWTRILLPLTLGVAFAKHRYRHPDIPPRDEWRKAGRRAAGWLRDQSGERGEWLADADALTRLRWFLAILLTPALFLRGGSHVVGALIAGVDEPDVRDVQLPIVTVVEDVPWNGEWAGRLFSLAIGMAMIHFGFLGFAYPGPAWVGTLLTAYWTGQIGWLVADPLMGIVQQLPLAITRGQNA